MTEVCRNCTEVLSEDETCSCGEPNFPVGEPGMVFIEEDYEHTVPSHDGGHADYD